MHPCGARRPARRSRSLLLGLAAGALCAGALAAGEARAADRVEVGPWLGWAAGVESRGKVEDSAASLNIGLDATALWFTFGSWTGSGDFEMRIGPWAAFDPIAYGTGAGEGGLTMILTQTTHAQWGTFGIRFGGGYGGDHVAFTTVTFTGGVRYVPDRAGLGNGGVFSTVTGLRIVATIRNTVDPYESTAFLFGVEFEPQYFLPPYTIDKWTGHH